MNHEENRKNSERRCSTDRRHLHRTCRLARSRPGDRKDALSVDGFEGSGADWLEQYKPYIKDGKTVVTSPHKVYGPETNDLVLQLRKRGIDKVILAGMSANLCTDVAHARAARAGF